MTDAHDCIRRGLEDTIAHARGEAGRGRVDHVEVPDVDVAAVRAKTGLSQGEFARSIGVARATLQNWEQGRRRPTGPSRVLLALIDRRPRIVKELLAGEAA